MENINVFRGVIKIEQYEFEGALFKPDTCIRSTPSDGYVSFQFEDKYGRNFGFLDMYKFGTEYETYHQESIYKERLNKIVSNKDGLSEFLKTKVNQLLDGLIPPHDGPMSREQVKQDVEIQIRLGNVDHQM
ncbi:hypothetical protein [Priestia endophytica]|uniref:hypothetical protein n=1 Tax=Priestia endophytica TaxID=135735 RepID=UPI000DCA4D81|nr:hypothetical protein [Priestia endophytica]RAS83133.1 hypothetical protein A4U60_11945 [Priestia endophytica]